MNETERQIVAKDAHWYADRLNETQRNALFFPKGYHSKKTMRAMRMRGLIEFGQVTELGEKVRRIIRDKQDG